MPDTVSGRSFLVTLETPEGIQTLACGEHEYLWDAAARNGVELPAICHQGRCLSCAGKLIDGLLDQRDADTFFPEDEAAGLVLLCRAKPRSDVRIRTHQADQMRAYRLANGLPAPYA